MRWSSLGTFGLVLGVALASPAAAKKSSASSSSSISTTSTSTSKSIVSSSSSTLSTLTTTGPASTCTTTGSCYSAFLVHTKTLSSVCSGLSTETAAPAGYSSYCPSFTSQITSICECLMPATWSPPTQSSTTSSSATLSKSTSVRSPTKTSSSSSSSTKTITSPKQSTSTTSTSSSTSTPLSTTCSYTLPSTEPSSLICGEYGSITSKTNYTILTASGVQSLSGCEGLCQHASCVSFGFSETSNQCTVYSASLDTMGFKKSSSGNTVYYNTNCFELSCSTVSATATSSSSSMSSSAFLSTSTSTSSFTSTTSTTSTSSAPTNEITPGYFSNTTWDGWVQGAYQGTTSVGAVSPGYVSATAGYIYANAGGNQAYQEMQYNLTYTSGMLYNFSMYYMTNNADCFLYIMNGQSWLTWLGPYGDPITANEWSLLNMSFIYESYLDGGNQEPFENADYYLTIHYECDNSDTGTAYFDAIQLFSQGPEIYTANSTPTGSNLVTPPNVNFDDSTLGAWTTACGQDSCSFSITSPGYNSSAYAAHINVQPYATPSLNLQIPTTTDIAYLVSVAYNYTGDGSWCSLLLNLQDESGVVYQTALYESYPEGGGKGPSFGTQGQGLWALAQGVATSPVMDGFVSVQPYCVMNFEGSGSGAIDFYVGDVQVVPLS